MQQGPKNWQVTEREVNMNHDCMQLFTQKLLTGQTHDSRVVGEVPRYVFVVINNNYTSVLVIPCIFCVYGQYTTSARRARAGVLGHRHKIAWDK